jgi:hypothetical protein
MSTRPKLVLYLAGLVLLVLPTAVSAQLATWNQDRVTAIAREAAEKTSKLYDVFYQQPPATIGSAQARSYYELKQSIRRVRREAGYLASELEAGKGQEETSPIYSNLAELVNRSTEEARRTFTSDDLLGAAISAGDAMRRLAPYYDPKAASNPNEE